MRILFTHSGNMYGGVETMLATLAGHRRLCLSRGVALASATEGRVGNDAQRLAATTYLRWNWQKWHVGLIFTGLMLRVTFGLMTSKDLALADVDGREYYAYAQSLLGLQWDNYPRYFNCIRPPLYPVFLVPFVAASDHYVWHIQLAQAVLGVLQAVVLAKIAGRWSGHKAGNWALGLALFHPFLIFYPAFVLTETLFIFLLWLGIACLQRLDDPQLRNQAHWLTLSAIVLGLASLTRPALQPFLVVAVLWIGWRALRQSVRMVAFKRMVYFGVVVSGILLPFMVRNFYVHREFSLAPGNAQLVYSQGNSLDYLRTYRAQSKEEYYTYINRLNAHFGIETGTPPETWVAEANDFCQNHFREWLRLQLYKFRHFWTPWLNPLIFPRSTFLLSLFSATPLFLLGAIEVFRRRTHWDSFMVLLFGLIAVGYLVSGFLFHVQVRYRIPFVDVTAIVLTASFLANVSRKWVTDSFPIRRLLRMEPKRLQLASTKG